MMNTSRLTHVALAMVALAALLHGTPARAQLLVQDTLTGNSTKINWLALGGACLTAGTGTNPPGSPPACVGLPIYSTSNQGKTTLPQTQVGGVSGRLPDPIGQGALRLTNGDTALDGSNGDWESGAVIWNANQADGTPGFPTNQGVQVSWTSVTYGGDGLSGYADGSWRTPKDSNGKGTGTGADGMSFYLMDAGTKAHPIAGTVGAFGGSLGYSCSNLPQNSTVDGVNAAYLGIGIDAYGNFSNSSDNTNTGSGFKAGRISVRGAGSTNWNWLSTQYPAYYPATLSSVLQRTAVTNTCKSGSLWDFSKDSAHPVVTTTALKYNYGFISSSDLPTGLSISNQQGISSPLRGAATPIVYSLRISADGLLDFSYVINGGTAQTVITGRKITDSNGPLPQNFRFGFSGGTGGGSNVQEITCFKAEAASQSNSSAGSNVQPAARVVSGSQVYLAYYHPFNSWGQLTAQSVVYDSATDLLTVSQAVNWDASCVLTGGSCASTGKSSAAQDPTSRVILTSANGTGVPFRWDNGVNAAQQGQLTDGETANANRLNYLRGDRSNEAASGGGYRTRTSVLGDIVDSSPVLVGAPNSPYLSAWVDKLNGKTVAEGDTYQAFATANALRANIVYVGANDGLLHGFRSGNLTSSGAFDATQNDGQEVLAYVPSQVVSILHSATSALDYSNTRYSHNDYVDATPGSGDLFFNGAWHTWLAGALGPGGQASGPVADPTAVASNSVYLLDITHPQIFTEANASSVVAGEVTYGTLAASACKGSSGSCANNLGQVGGAPVIRRLHDGNWAVLWGNGLNSSAGSAGLFILHIDSATGAQSMQYIDTGYGSAKDPQSKGYRNGIVQVTPADLDGDHVTDFVYAADFFGNLWRFDLTNADPQQWKAGAAPLFSTPSGQPVTTRVAVSAIPTPGAGDTKVLVAFGTGEKLPQNLGASASYATGSQALYGIWDWDMTAWNAASKTVKYDALTAPQTVAVSSLQAQSVTSTLPASNGVLGYRSLSSLTVCWAGFSVKCATPQYGWRLTLPTASEQVIFNPTTINGLFIVDTTIPATAQLLTCGVTSSSGYTMAVQLASGGAAPSSTFPDPSGSFTTTNISGISVDGSGTVSLMAGGQQLYAVQQTLEGIGRADKINAPLVGKGGRINWTKIR
jgi:type IV pilus assembly protein PilY1